MEDGGQWGRRQEPFTGGERKIKATFWCTHAHTHTHTHTHTHIEGEEQYMSDERFIVYLPLSLSLSLLLGKPRRYQDGRAGEAGLDPSLPLGVFLGLSRGPVRINTPPCKPPLSRVLLRARALLIVEFFARRSESRLFLGTGGAQREPWCGVELERENMLRRGGHTLWLALERTPTCSVKG